MNLNLIISIGVLAFMIVSFMIHKISYGLTAMICVGILAITGVITPETAFSGFSATATVTCMCMIVVAGAINKTSLMGNIKSWIAKKQAGKGIFFVALVCLAVPLLTQFMGMTALIAFMLVLASTLNDEDDVNPARMIFLVAAISCAWTGKFPIGMGAVYPLSTNTLYTGLVNDNPEYLIGMFDILKIGAIPAVVLTIYCFFAWRLLPKTKLDASAMAGAEKKPTKEIVSNPKQDRLIYIIFTVVMLCFAFSNQLGQLLYVIPFVAILVLILTKVFTPEEAIRMVTSDMMWMIAGVQVISAAMGTSGAANLVGNFIMNLLGGNPSPLMVLVVFAVAATILTNFMYNTGCSAVMTPIAASTALACGMNPKTVILVVFCSTLFAIALPTGSVAATLAYAIGRYEPVKCFKFTIPFLILGIISLVVSAMLFFPIYM